MISWDRENALVRVIQRTPDIFLLCCRLRVIPHCPFWVVNGLVTWTVVGEPSDLRQFLRTVSGAIVSMRSDSLTPSGTGTLQPFLTHRQADLFAQALEKGYFEVPRQLSLTALALHVGISKSTLSRALAVVEMKFMHEAGNAWAPAALSEKTKPVRN
jgi:hypothetical protein